MNYENLFRTAEQIAVERSIIAPEPAPYLSAEAREKVATEFLTEAARWARNCTLEARGETR